MDKARAIDALGGIASAAEAIGVSYAAVGKWPDKLPRRISDRVIAAMLRRGQSLRDIKALMRDQLTATEA